jgi:hypothetical protein
MTKTEATKLAIDFTNGEIEALKNSAFDTLIASSMTRFWEGLLAELQDLLSGEYEEEDCVPFICYQTLKDTPVAEVFLEAWGADIGRQGTSIHLIVTSLEDGLKNSDNEKN